MSLSATKAGERPRMVKTKDGVSHKQISVAAILGEDHAHLPIYVDKIRTTVKAIEEERNVGDRYLTRTYAVSLDAPKISKTSISTKSLQVGSSCSSIKSRPRQGSNVAKQRTISGNSDNRY